MFLIKIRYNINVAQQKANQQEKQAGVTFDSQQQEDPGFLLYMSLNKSVFHLYG